MRRRALLAAVLAVAATLPACRRHKRQPRFARAAAPTAGAVLFVYEIDFARAWQHGNREELAARTANVLRARLADLTEGGLVRVQTSGSGVEVFLPGAGPAAMYEAWRRTARLPGRFEVTPTIDGRPVSGGLANEDIADAAVGVGHVGRPDLVVDFTARGRRKFTELTTRSVGHKIAIVIDGKIEMDPIVNEPISSGRMRMATDAHADRSEVWANMENLATALRSGPLPAPLMFMVEEQVAQLP